MRHTARLLPIEQLAADLPRIGISTAGASIKSAVLVPIVVGLELLLLRSESPVLIVIGVLMSAIHGAISLTLAREVTLLFRDLRRGIRGYEPVYLTKDKIEKALSSEERLGPLAMAVMFFAFATPLYPLSKYLFFQLFSVHAEYFRDGVEAIREQVRLPLDDEPQLQPAPPAPLAWANLARAQAESAIHSWEDPMRPRAHA